MKTESKFNALMRKFNKWGYKKKDNYPNLPETPRKQRTSWLGRLLYTDGQPIWQYDPFRVESDRWGQLKDPRWLGTGRVIWNFLLYAIGFLSVMWYFESEGFVHYKAMFFGLAACISIAWVWLLLQPTIGEVQDNSYLYDKPRGEIVKNSPENVRFNRYRSYHLRDYWVKVAFAIIYCIINWIANGAVAY